MDDGFTPGAIVGMVLGAVIVGWAILGASTHPDTAYAKGIADCRSGKVSYTVTVGPEGVDTTYTYRP